MKAPSLPAANENTRPMESSPPQSDSAVVYPVPLEAADPNVLLNQLVEAVPQLVWSTRADGWCDYFNQKWYEYTGASFVEHGGIGWQNALYPDDLARTVAAWQSAVESGSPFEVEYRLRRADGVYRWFLARGLPIRDASGQVVRWFGTSTDIEEQKQGEARQRFLAELSERTRLPSNPEEVLLTALTLLGNYLDVARASYDDIDLANDLVRVGVEYRREDRPPISGSFPLSSFGPEMVADLTAGRTVLLPDTSQDPRTRQTFDTQYQPLQVRAFIAAPVIKDGVLVRVLSVSVTGPRVWTEEEAALVSAVAERTWLAAENARLYQAARQEIAERRRAEERYRSLTDAMVSVVWSTGPNGLFIQPQPSWEAYTGQGWEEQKEGRAISALHPEDREKASRVWYEAVRAVRPFESEQRLWNAASQQFRWCTVRGVPLKNADGSVREWVGVHTDIHERRLRAEMQNLLAMMNEHILTLTDPNEILWRVINLVGEELTLNRCHFIEVDFERDVATIPQSYLHDAVSTVGGILKPSEFGSSEFWDALRQGRTTVIGDTATHPMTRVFYQTSYLPINVGSFVAVPCMSGGKCVAVLIADTRLPRVWLTEELGLLEAIAHRTWLSIENARLFRAMREEVTERKRIEAEQDRLYLEVASHQKRMDDLLATVPGMVWESWGPPSGETQQMAFVSRYVEEMLGYPVEDWLTIPNFWLTVVHPDDRNSISQSASGNFTGGAVNVNEFRWIDKQGGTHWISAHSVTVKNDAGIAVGMRGVNLDITARVEAEREIEALNERLRRAMQETHHRVRNNLQIIAALVETQSYGVEMVPAAELQRIGSHVTALAAVHDLLTEQAKRDTIATDISARELLHKLITLVQSTSTGCQITEEITDARLTSRQGTSLSLIAHELITNASKYGHGEATVRFQVQGNQATLEVRDNSPGFPPGFAPSQSATTGLSLVTHIAQWDLFAEQVRFETHPAGGGLVTIVFPLTTDGG